MVATRIDVGTMPVSDLTVLPPSRDGRWKPSLYPPDRALFTIDHPRGRIRQGPFSVISGIRPYPSGLDPSSTQPQRSAQFNGKGRTVWHSAPGHSQSTSLRSTQQESTKHHLKAPRRLGLLSPYKRAGQGSTTGGTTKKYKKQQAKRKIEINISSNHPCPLFPLFETWARRSLSHACNPYTSTSVQGNTNFSPLPLDVGPSFARIRINPRVFSLHHHPGKRHAAFTRWFRTPSGPNTDIMLINL
jgi:hypothetical protein